MRVVNRLSDLAGGYGIGGAVVRASTTCVLC